MMHKNNTSHRLSESDKLQRNLKKSKRHLIVKRIHLLCIWVSTHLYRALEIVIAMTVILFTTLPLCLILILVKVATGRAVFVEEEIVGQEGIPVNIRYFNISWQPASSLALFFHVVTGKLSLISRSIKAMDDDLAIPENGYLNTMRPGVVSLWQVRKNSNIAHEGLLATEWEYYFTRNMISDLLLFLRAIPTYFFTNTQQINAKLIHLFGVYFVNLTMKEAVQLIEQKATDRKNSSSVFFVNPDCLNKTFSDKSYLHILKHADYVFPDGIGLTIACKILRSPLRENVNGTDMLPFLCEMAVQKNLSLFLLGARPGVSEAMSAQLQKRYNVEIAGTHHGYFNHEQESQDVVEKINGSGADIVLVAFGAPLQEKWISANKEKLQTGVVMGVGGLFDFYSGNTQRAPRWLRELGLEWVYRILQEPRRMWHRYVVGNPLFLFRVFMWKSKYGKEQ